MRRPPRHIPSPPPRHSSGCRDGKSPKDRYFHCRTGIHPHDRPRLQRAREAVACPNLPVVNRHRRRPRSPPSIARTQRARAIIDHHPRMLRRRPCTHPRSCLRHPVCQSPAETPRRQRSRVDLLRRWSPPHVWPPEEDPPRRARWGKWRMMNPYPRHPCRNRAEPRLPPPPPGEGVWEAC